MKSETTHFGFEEVLVSEKVKRVAAVFNHVAPRYDLMNDLMSFGIHRLWKQTAVLLSGVKPGQTVLDVACGTGDLTGRLLKKLKNNGVLIGTDINAPMLMLGRDNLTNQGALSKVDFVQADCECLPFADNVFDCVTIAFGLRNVTQKEAALSSFYRVLKPGGRCIVLEFSTVAWEWLKPLYDLFSFKVIPALGEWVLNDRASYQYLVESIRKHPNPETLKTMMQDALFESCDYFSLTGGVAAVHRGFKF